MNIFFEFLFAFLLILPFLIMTYWINIQRLPTRSIVPPMALYGAVLAIVIWRVNIYQVIAVTIKGLWLSYELCWVAFWGFIFQQPFRQSRGLSVIRETIRKFAPDPRVQAILIAWFFGGFLEGVLGFAATGGLCTIMLGGLGFAPMCAIMLSIAGPITAATFNSAGTPILYGVAHGMDDPAFAAFLAHSGHTLESFLKLVTAQTAILSGITGIFVPLMLVFMMTRFFSEKPSWMRGLEMAPFAIFCGLAFVIPYVLTAIFLGPEFPSIIGSIVGGAIAMVAIKLNFLVPEKKWELPPQSTWRHDWAPTKTKFKPEALSNMPLKLAIMPFWLLTLCLVITRLPPLRGFLKGITFEWHHIFKSSISVVSEPFYMPVTWIVIAVMIVATIAFKLNTAQIRAYWMPAIIPTASMLVKAPFAVALILIYTTSSISSSSLPSMLQVFSNAVAHIPYSYVWYPFISPFIAGLATTLGTNNTFGNLIMTPIQYNLEQTLHLPTGFLVSLAAAGSCPGTMIAWRYLTSTVTVMAMLGWEGPVGRRMMIPTILYSVMLGTLGVAGVLFFNFSAFVMQHLKF